jgi:predicted nucleic acid-binding protein
MTRVALDSNILIYAELEPGSGKGRRSSALILRASRDGVIPAQALGEYFRVVQRRAPQLLSEAILQAEIYKAAFLTPPTTDEIVTIAVEIARAHKLQLWDSVICAVAQQADAKVLLSEDMQDGRVLDGLRIVNPFNQANAAAIEALLGG